MNRRELIAKRKQQQRIRGILSISALIIGIVLVFSVSGLVTNARSTNDAPEYKYFTSYELQNGDSLWSIASDYYEDHYKSLNDYIYVKYISINETAGHASLRYLSTLAVLQLDAILPNAILKESKPINAKTKNQKGFKRMLIMEYLCPGIGLVRLTVGQKGSDDTKVQYCITAIASVINE